MAASEDREVLRQHIEEHKREVRLAVEELTQAVSSAWPDPREHIRERPYVWMLGGLLVGLWLGWPDGDRATMSQPGGYRWPR